MTRTRKYRLPRRDHRYGGERRQQSNELPEAEVFFQDQARQQDSHRWVERSENNGLLPAPALAGGDEQRAGRDVEKSRQHSERNTWAVETEWCAHCNYRNRSGRERTHAGDNGNPKRRTTGLVGTEEEARESDAGEGGHAHCGWDARGFFHVVVLRFRAGDEPDGENRYYETGCGPPARCPFRHDVDQRGDGRSHQRRDRSRQAHFSEGEGAIKDRQRESSGGACGERPDDARAREEFPMLS